MLNWFISAISSLLIRFPRASPRELITGMKTDYYKVSRVCWGDFAMIYNKHKFSHGSYRHSILSSSSNSLTIIIQYTKNFDRKNKTGRL
jgi:hypothetical protein